MILTFAWTESRKPRQPCQDSRYLGQDLNPGLYEHEARILTIQPIQLKLVIIMAFITAQCHEGREQGIPTSGCRV
jgi:hypothetical protein